MPVRFFLGGYTADMDGRADGVRYVEFTIRRTRQAGGHTAVRAGVRT